MIYENVIIIKIKLVVEQNPGLIPMEVKVGFAEINFAGIRNF